MSRLVAARNRERRQDLKLMDDRCEKRMSVKLHCTGDCPSWQKVHGIRARYGMSPGQNQPRMEVELNGSQVRMGNKECTKRSRMSIFAKSSSLEVYITLYR